MTLTAARDLVITTDGDFVVQVRAVHNPDVARSGHLLDFGTGV